MKDTPGAMNQTTSAAINRQVYPPPNGIKHELILHSQCDVVPDRHRVIGPSLPLYERLGGRRGEAPPVVAS